METKKFAVFHLSNGYQLSVRISPEGGLSYHLNHGPGLQSHAISNLQLKRTLPHFRSLTGDATIADVRRSLNSGIWQVHEIETAPEPVDKAAELEAKLQEARELGLYWQAEAERLMEVLDEHS